MNEILIEKLKKIDCFCSKGANEPMLSETLVALNDLCEKAWIISLIFRTIVVDGQETEFANFVEDCFGENLRESFDNEIQSARNILAKSELIDIARREIIDFWEIEK